MPELQVSVVLPYYLQLAEGVYQTAQVDEVVQIAPFLREVFREPVTFGTTCPRVTAGAIQ
jgi:hypothetical protein